MVARTVCDLGHYAFRIGHLGRLLPVAAIPVIAGDSMQVSAAAAIKLSPLRRGMMADAKVEYFGFYVPYRHIIDLDTSTSDAHAAWNSASSSASRFPFLAPVTGSGQSWADMIREGDRDTNRSIPNDTIPSGNNVDFFPFNSYLPAGRIVPFWLIRGYNYIWNSYFRPPTREDLVKLPTQIGNTDIARRYGHEVGPMKTIWSTGHTYNRLEDGDNKVPIDNDQLDLVDFKKTRNSYRNQIDRDWFDLTYSKVLNDTFGGGVSGDVDLKPELLFRDSSSISGYDIPGTADENTGEITGMAGGGSGFRMGRKFFPEHGTFWMMMVIRWPSIHINEAHYLMTHPSPSYKEFIADPALWMNEPPREHFVGDFFDDGSVSPPNPATTPSLGHQPYGQWYRYHPNCIHSKWKEVEGVPFMQNNPASKNEAQLQVKDPYDHVFQTEQLGQFVANMRIDCTAYRPIPAAIRSVYAGA